MPSLLILLCVGIVALTSAAGCKKAHPDDESDEASEPEKKKKKKKEKREALFGQVRIGAHGIAAFPIEGEHPKLWRFKVHYLGDDIIKYERLSPTGLVHASAEIVKTKDGLEVVYYDAHGILLDRQEVHDGRVTSRQRDGGSMMNGCEIVEERYDDRGRVARRRCLDRAGQLVADADGCHQEARSFDARDALLSTRCLDADDQLKNDRLDTHQRTHTYGKRGEELTVTFTKVSGEHPAGCATIGFDYDDALNVVQERCLDGDGKPVAYLGSKAIATKTSYDAHGCETKVHFEDAEGRPATRAGVAEWRYERNPLCESTLEEARDLKGELMAPQPGIPARLRLTRDDAGQISERRCFGPNEKPTACRQSRGVATVIRYEYDEQGRLTAWLGFDAEGKAQRQDFGYPHKFAQHHNAKGQVVKQEFFDDKGEPAVALGGVHATVTTYDEVGLLKSIATQGLDGELVMPSTLCPTIAFERNDKHQLTAMRCLGIDGKPRQSRLIFEELNWQGAASLEIVREGGKLTNVLRSAGGAVIKTIDCYREGAACMQ